MSIVRPMLGGESKCVFVKAELQGKQKRVLAGVLLRGNVPARGGYYRQIALAMNEMSSAKRINVVLV